MCRFSEKAVLKIVTMKRSIQLQETNNLFEDSIFCETIKTTCFVVAITTVFHKIIIDSAEVDTTE